MAPRPKEFRHEVGEYQEYETAFVENLPVIYQKYGEKLTEAAESHKGGHRILEQHRVCFLPKKASALLRVQHNFFAAYGEAIAEFGKPEEKLGHDYATPVIGGVAYYSSNIQIIPYRKGAQIDTNALRINALRTAIEQFPEEDIPIVFDTHEIPEGYPGRHENKRFAPQVHPRDAILELIDVYEEHGIMGIQRSLYRPPEHLAVPITQLTAQLTEIRQVLQFHILEQMKLRRESRKIISIKEIERLFPQRFKKSRVIPHAEFDGMLNALSEVTTATLLNSGFSDEELEAFRVAMEEAEKASHSSSDSDPDIS